MLRTRPLSTSTFRLTLAYLGLFSLSAAIILAVVYIASARFMDRQIARARSTTRSAGCATSLSVAGLAGAAMLRRRARRGRAQPPRDLPPGRSARGIGLPAISTGWPTVRPDADGFVAFEVQSTRTAGACPSSIDATAQAWSTSTAASACSSGATSRTSSRPSARCAPRSCSASGVMVVLGLVGGLIMSRWMLSRLERINRATRADHGRRSQPADRDRRRRRRVRRAGAEPER